MSDESVRVYRFGDEEIDAPVDMSIEEVRETWSQVHAALANAEYTENEDGSVTFTVRGGSKG